MFENILHQNHTVTQLKADIDSGMLAPSILFSGPEYSGKGTAALELARVLCCEDDINRGRWNCACPSCVRHRNLVSPDLLLLGRRRFFEECAASSGALLRNPDNAGSKMLFIRSVRKLLARFNGVLWEDDPRLGKLKSQIGALEEELEDVEARNADSSASGDGGNKGAGTLAKQCEGIVKKAAKLEAEGPGEIPIAQIRRAAYWSRLAPLGRHKCVIIENAENMREGAKNSLLKILEEPPPRLTLILTSSRPMALLPTMLSRLREYRFAKRSVQAEIDVISRIFRENSPDNAGKKEGVAANQIYGPIEFYLTSFLPVNADTLYPLGAFFAASVAAEAVRELRERGGDIPGALTDLGKFAAPIAKAGGLPVKAGGGAEETALATVLDKADRFETPGLFVRFLQQCTALVSAWLRSGGESPDIAAGKTAPAELWRRELNRSMTENDSFNIAPPLVLERLFGALKAGMI